MFVSLSCEVELGTYRYVCNIFNCQYAMQCTCLDEGSNATAVPPIHVSGSYYGKKVCNIFNKLKLWDDVTQNTEKL